MPLDSDRIRALHAAKLRALTRSVLGTELADLSATDDGALAIIGGSSHAEPSRAVVCLAQERAERALGGALALADRNGCEQVHVFAEHRSGVLARRAGCFAPKPVVWRVVGADAAVAKPAPRPVESTPARVPELVALLADAGVDVVAEHGVITGEIEGLEIARIVSAVPIGNDVQRTDGAAGSESVSDWRIEVGVGVHDRQAFSVLHADEPTIDSIRRVAETVRRHRSPGASPHPLNRLAAARWLRSRLIAQPALVGAGRLRTASPPSARGGPKDPAPAVAYGLTPEGRRLVVVVCVGVDLDAVPFAADARLFLDPDAELTIALPRRDAHEVIRSMAARLRDPAQIAEIDDDWRAPA